MKQRGMKYDGSIDKYPISRGEIYALENGSSIQVADIIKDGIPQSMKNADCVFIDPAGNKGVLKSYYTKADEVCPVSDFDEFVSHIKRCINEISPERLFVECFQTNKTTLVNMVKELFPCVRIYESMYYHKKENKAWIIQGTKKEENYNFDGMDEWDIAMLIPSVVPLNSIADFFMGQGLIAQSAFKAGKVFYGSDMNRNRLAVGINKVSNLGGVWSVKK